MSNFLTGPTLVSPGNVEDRFDSAVVAVGTRHFNEEGSFIFVGCGTSNVNSGEPLSVTSAGLAAVVRGDSDLGAFIGHALKPFTSGEYGFARLTGLTSVYLPSGVAAGGAIQLSSTIGQYAALTTSGQQVGIALEASPNAGGLTDVILGV